MKYDYINTPKMHNRNLFSAWILGALLFVGSSCAGFLDAPTTSDVSIPEVYSMLAECYLRNNNQSKALYYLNELRKNEMHPAIMPIWPLPKPSGYIMQFHADWIKNP